MLSAKRTFGKPSALKGVLRLVGVEPPKFHDVGPILAEHRARLPAEVSAHLDRLREISRRLRKEREFAFYGDVDFIPTEQYSQQDAMSAASDARFVVQVASAARATLAGGRQAGAMPRVESAEPPTSDETPRGGSQPAAG